MPEIDAGRPHDWQFVSRSEHETRALGRTLGELIEPGTVVALVGNLGAGKTRLVQAVAEGLGVERRDVNSPTFILIQEYAGRLPVYHFDTYRLRDVDEFLELGADEILQSHGVSLVEWADRVAEVLPDDVLRIEIEIAGENTRVLQFSGTGPRARDLLERLQHRCDSAERRM